MKRLALVLVLAAAVPVFSQEKEKAKEKEKESAQPVLPFNPLASAKEGDWTVFKCTVAEPDKTTKRVQSWKVVKVGEKTITTEQAADDEKAAESVELPAKEPPTIAKFCDIGDEQVRDVKVTDEKKTVAGREFTCKKVAFATYNGERVLRGTLWISSEVKGSGVVAIRVEGDLAEPKGAKVSVDFEVAGFGSKDKTEFGKTRAELAKELASDKGGNK